MLYMLYMPFAGHAVHAYLYMPFAGHGINLAAPFPVNAVYPFALYMLYVLSALL